MLKTKGGKRVSKPTDIPTQKRLTKTFKDGKNETVKIGFPAANSETQSTKDGVTALFKATVNNYGLGVPKRPFMQIAYAQNLKKYRNILKKDLGKKPQKQVLEIIGSIGAGDVKKTIRDLKNPPNSALTIKIKGSDNPLIDSAHMFSSVSYAVVEK